MGFHFAILNNTSSSLMPAPCQGLEIKYLTSGNSPISAWQRESAQYKITVKIMTLGCEKF